MKKLGIVLLFICLTVLSGCEGSGKKEIREYQEMQEKASKALDDNKILNGELDSIEDKIEELGEKLEEAKQNNDYDEMEKIEKEIDELMDELGIDE